ncbi:MAG: hypothetical protein CMI58_05940 [Parcubacteria group bacterium]|jgi:ubiquinone/menaquinone biosynthesis C-methylase UbiE|nr:hypothetical protein [Parcubacteria group bacterium]|tara:strand:+ start:10515 stop:11552 length:1038 start_codon:yes stop_codon:yes gene_type:complete
MKTLKNKFFQIKKIVKKIPKTRFNYEFLIREFIFLILRVENILLDRNYKKNPITITNNYLDEIIKRLNNLSNMRFFDGRKKIDYQNFKREKNHKDLFQKLWTHFDHKQFIKNRLKNYLARIKINNLQKYFKNKNCIDFGCGHGQFLMAMHLKGAKFCQGIDFGRKSIAYARKARNKLKINKKKVKFTYATVYKAPVKSNSFDFAIQNGVFHHLDNENKAYKEVYRVLKKGGYFFILTSGGGGVRDLVFDHCQNILKNIEDAFVVKVIRDMGVTNNKIYMLSDMLNAKYRQTTWTKFKKRLKGYGFGNFEPLQGGEKTDWDFYFSKDKLFKVKFGSGHIRLLCQKI